jgi:hypothetical protein
MTTIWSGGGIGTTSSANATGVLFIDTGGGIGVDLSDFVWDQTNNRLSVGHGGDTSGTDTINIYKQGDSYLPVSSIVEPYITPGWSVSSSRGTGLVPSILLTGDPVGKFAGFGYTGVSPAYAEIGNIAFRAVGATAANLGGEAFISTKADGGALVERAKVDNVGVLSLKAGLRPAQDSGAYQTVSAMYAGTGVPSNANGANGDFYFRGDTPGVANQRLYIKSAGAWVALTL